MALAELAPFLIAAALLLALAVLLPLAASRARRGYEAMAEELATHGFAVGKRPRLFASGFAGTYRGREASVKHVKHGKSGPWTTDVRVSRAGPAGFTLRIDPEGAGTALVKALGGKDVPLEDPPFDRAFRLRTSDRERALFVLDAHARASLVADRPWRLEVTARHVSLHLKGRVTATDRLGQGLAFAARLAERVEATA